MEPKSGSNMTKILHSINERYFTSEQLSPTMIDEKVEDICGESMTNSESHISVIEDEGSPSANSQLTFFPNQMCAKQFEIVKENTNDVGNEEYDSSALHLNSSINTCVYSDPTQSSPAEHDDFLSDNLCENPYQRIEKSIRKREISIQNSVPGLTNEKPAEQHQDIEKVTHEDSVCLAPEINNDITEVEIKSPGHIRPTDTISNKQIVCEEQQHENNIQNSNSEVGDKYITDILYKNTEIDYPQSGVLTGSNNNESITTEQKDVATKYSVEVSPTSGPTDWKRHAVDDQNEFEGDKAISDLDFSSSEMMNRTIASPLSEVHEVLNDDNSSTAGCEEAVKSVDVFSKPKELTNISSNDTKEKCGSNETDERNAGINGESMIKCSDAVVEGSKDTQAELRVSHVTNCNENLIKSVTVNVPPLPTLNENETLYAKSKEEYFIDLDESEVKEYTDNPTANESKLYAKNEILMKNEKDNLVITADTLSHGLEVSTVNIHDHNMIEHIESNQKTNDNSQNDLTLGPSERQYENDGADNLETQLKAACVRKEHTVYINLNKNLFENIPQELEEVPNERNYERKEQSDQKTERNLTIIEEGKHLKLKDAKMNESDEETETQNLSDAIKMSTANNEHEMHNMPNLDEIYSNDDEVSPSVKGKLNKDSERVENDIKTNVEMPINVYPVMRNDKLRAESNAVDIENEPTTGTNFQMGGITTTEQYTSNKIPEEHTQVDKSCDNGEIKTQENKNSSTSENHNSEHAETGPNNDIESNDFNSRNQRDEQKTAHDVQQEELKTGKQNVPYHTPEEHSPVDKLCDNKCKNEEEQTHYNKIESDNEKPNSEHAETNPKDCIDTTGNSLDIVSADHKELNDFNSRNQWDEQKTAHDVQQEEIKTGKQNVPYHTPEEHSPVDKFCDNKCKNEEEQTHYNKIESDNEKPNSEHAETNPKDCIDTTGNSLDIVSADHRESNDFNSRNQRDEQKTAHDVQQEEIKTGKQNVPYHTPEEHSRVDKLCDNKCKNEEEQTHYNKIESDNEKPNSEHAETNPKDCIDTTRNSLDIVSADHKELNDFNSRNQWDEQKTADDVQQEEIKTGKQNVPYHTPEEHSPVDKLCDNKCKNEEEQTHYNKIESDNEKPNSEHAETNPKDCIDTTGNSLDIVSADHRESNDFNRGNQRDEKKTAHDVQQEEIKTGKQNVPYHTPEEHSQGDKLCDNNCQKEEEQTHYNTIESNNGKPYSEHAEIESAEHKASNDFDSGKQRDVHDVQEDEIKSGKQNISYHTPEENSPADKLCDNKCKKEEEQTHDNKIESNNEKPYSEHAEANPKDCVDTTLNIESAEHTASNDFDSGKQRDVHDVQEDEIKSGKQNISYHTPEENSPADKLCDNKCKKEEEHTHDNKIESNDEKPYSEHAEANPKDCVDTTLNIESAEHTASNDFDSGKQRDVHDVQEDEIKSGKPNISYHTPEENSPADKLCDNKCKKEEEHTHDNKIESNDEKPYSEHAEANPKDCVDTTLNIESAEHTASNDFDSGKQRDVHDVQEDEIKSGKPNISYHTPEENSPADKLCDNKCKKEEEHTHDNKIESNDEKPYSEHAEANPKDCVDTTLNIESAEHTESNDFNSRNQRDEKKTAHDVQQEEIKTGKQNVPYDTPEEHSPGDILCDNNCKKEEEQTHYNTIESNNGKPYSEHAEIKSAEHKVNDATSIADFEGEQETTHNIGNKSTEAIIGNQNLPTGRSKHSKDGLLERFSDQLFAETHLRSFWKENQMNKGIPIGTNVVNNDSQRPKQIRDESIDNYGKDTNITENQRQTDFHMCDTLNLTMTNEHIQDDSVTNTDTNVPKLDIVEPVAMLESLKYLQHETTNSCIYSGQSGDLPNREIDQEIETLEEITLLDSTKDFNTIPARSAQFDTSSMVTFKNQNADQERIPRYFYGIQSPPSKENLLPRRKMYKEPTAFIIPFENVKNALYQKPLLRSSSREDDPYIQIDMEYFEVEPQIDSESPTKLFRELGEFERDIDAFDIDITQAIDDIIRLKAENNVESTNSDENILFSRSADTVLHTIIELSEPETPKLEECRIMTAPGTDVFLIVSDKNSDSTTTSWTSGSKDTSYNSDDFLDEKVNEQLKQNNLNDKRKSIAKNNNDSDIVKGGIYEYDDNNRIEDLINLAPTPPSETPTLEEGEAYPEYLNSMNIKYNVNTLVSKNYSLDEAASVIQKAFRIYCYKKAYKSNNNDSKDQESLYKNSSATAIQKAFRKYLDGKQNFPMDSFHKNARLSQPNDLTMATSLNDPRIEWSKNIAATTIQKGYRSYIQRKAQRNNIDKLPLGTNLNEHGPEILSHDNLSNINVTTEDNVMEVNSSSEEPDNRFRSEFSSLESKENNAAAIIQNTFRTYYQRKIKPNSIAAKESPVGIYEDLNNHDPVGYMQNEFDHISIKSRLKNNESTLQEKCSDDHTHVGMSQTRHNIGRSQSTENRAAILIQNAFRTYLQRTYNSCTNWNSNAPLSRLDVNVKSNNPTLSPKMEEPHSQGIKKDCSQSHVGQSGHSDHSVCTEHNAATIIQKMFRAHLQRQAKHHNCVESHEDDRQNNTNEMEGNFNQYNNLSQIRGYTNPLDWNEGHAATVIQNAFRKYLKGYPRLEDEGHILSHNRTNSQCHISEGECTVQSAHSRIMTNNDFCGMQMEINDKPSIDIDDFNLLSVKASVVIQKAFRNYRLRQSQSGIEEHNFKQIIGHYEKADDAPNDLTQIEVLAMDNICPPKSTEWSDNAAALILQKAFRAYMQRRRNQTNFINFEPTAPLVEDFSNSTENSNSSEAQAAIIIQKAYRNFIDFKRLKEINVFTQVENGAEANELQVVKSNWYVGDEPIVAKSSLERRPSEISFEETEVYVELVDNPPYVVGNACRTSLEDPLGSSRIPTAPLSNRSDSEHLNNNDIETKFSGETVSEERVTDQIQIQMNTGTVDADLVEDPRNEEELNAMRIVEPLQSISKSNKEIIEKLKFLIDQFIKSERIYSASVNQYSMVHDVTKTRKINSEFVPPQIKSDWLSLQPYEKLQEACIKRSLSLTTEINFSGDVSNDETSSDSENEAEYSLRTKTGKLDEPEIAIEKMQQRRDSTSKVLNKVKPKKYSFEEPSVAPIPNFERNVDTDEESIVVSKLQHEDTRESSAQSDVIICGDEEGTHNLRDQNEYDVHVVTKGSLKRVHTIAADSDIRSLMKSVTIDESIKYIEPSGYEVNSDSFYLDDDTSDNIRRKMMAYSLSEADSDGFEKNFGNASVEAKPQTFDYFNVTTALVDNGDTSTETESTIVSAVTKIQAGARGYLTRKRLGRTSVASDCKSTTYGNNSKASFGNAAISESLEYLLHETAAKRIQQFYRKHYRNKINQTNKLQEQKIVPYSTTSVESTLAQKRSMLQRGDALRNNSTPDGGNSSSNGSETEKCCSEQQVQFPSDIRKQIIPQAKTSAAIRAKIIEDNKMKWLAMRQNSMPVQIDSEVFRVIPKHMRKKIKSADGDKGKRRRTNLYD